MRTARGRFRPYPQRELCGEFWWFLANPADFKRDFRADRVLGCTRDLFFRIPWLKLSLEMTPKQSFPKLLIVYYIAEKNVTSEQQEW